LEKEHAEDKTKVIVCFRNNNPKGGKPTRLVCIKHGGVQITQANVALWDNSEDKASKWACGLSVN
jgi:hypothetical protein